MTVTVGPVIGTGSVLNSNVITVTLTDDVPQSTPTAPVALLIVQAVKYPGSHLLSFIGVTDSALYRSPTPGYGTNVNGAGGSGNQWALAPFTIFDGTDTFGIKYFTHHPIKASLFAGDEVAIETSPFFGDYDWFAVNVHKVEGLRQPNPGPPDASGAQVDFGNWTSGDPFQNGVDVFNPWTQLVGASVVTTVDGDSFTMTGGGMPSTAEQYDLSLAGVFHGGYAFFDKDTATSTADLFLTSDSGNSVYGALVCLTEGDGFPYPDAFFRAMSFGPEAEPPVPTTAYQRIYGWRAEIDDNALETVELFVSPQTGATG